MLGYVFIILGGFTTFAFWSQNTLLAVISGLLTLAAAWTQYVVATKNKNVVVDDDKNYVSINMISSIAILILFIVSFFVGK